MLKKRCLLCQKDKTIDKYPINRRGYQRESDFGVCSVFRSCEIKQATKNMKCVKYNFESGRFDMVYFKTKKEIVEHFNK